MNKAISFIKESYEELRKVSWPSRKQTINYTLVVVGVSVAVAVFLGVLDMIFSSIVEKNHFLIICKLFIWLNRPNIMEEHGMCCTHIVDMRITLPGT